MSNTQDWDIQSRGSCCNVTGAEFEDGQVIWSRLCRGEEGFVREDYTVAAWEALADKGGLSVWKSTFRVPPPKAEEPLKKENAEHLLRRLMEMEDEESLNTIYILAVMLERKRILAERDVRIEDNGVKIRVYEHKKTGESFVIRDPELKLAELEAVQEEVVISLGGTPPGKKVEKPVEPQPTEAEPDA